MKNVVFLFIMICMPVVSLYAWDGYDYENGAYVEIEEGNLVRGGNDIELYDYGVGEYKTVEVQNIERTDTSVELEVYDYDSGEYRTFEIDAD